ncbi:MAG: hypothetical protein ACRDQ5_13330, partial [Sciscionella sp.]
HHWVWIVPALLMMVVESLRTRSAGWIVTTVVTAAVFYVGAHNFLPKANDLELGWSAWQHVVGDSYVLLTIALLVGWAAPAIRPAWRAAMTGLGTLLAERRPGSPVKPLQRAPKEVEPVENSPAE